MTLATRTDVEWGRLRASYLLERIRGIAVVAADAEARTQLRGAFLELAPHVRVDAPDGDVVQRIQAHAALHPGAAPLPAVWIEGDGFEAWAAAFGVLNRAREFLAERGPVFVVLAGPPELAGWLARNAPDLTSVAGPVVLMRDAPVVAPPRVIRWMQISGLRMGAPAYQTNNGRAFLEALWKDVPALLAKAGRTPDMLLVAGGLTARGRVPEFEAAERTLRLLAEELEIVVTDRMFEVPAGVGREAGPADLSLALPAEANVGSRVRYGAWVEMDRRLVGDGSGFPNERPWRSAIREINGFSVGIGSFCPGQERRGGLSLGSVREAMGALAGTDLRIALLSDLAAASPGEANAVHALRREAHVIVVGGTVAVRPGGPALELVVPTCSPDQQGPELQVVTVTPATGEVEIQRWLWGVGAWAAAVPVQRRRLATDFLAAGGAPGPVKQLARLLAGLFTADELRRFLRGHDLDASLPGAEAAPVLVAHAAAQELARRGRVDEALFDALTRERPERGAEIDAVREAVRAYRRR